jgi:hypothetical protein
MSNGTSFENAYKITTSADGTGAGWNEGSNSGTTLPLTGHTTGVNYFADGVNPIKTTLQSRRGEHERYRRADRERALHRPRNWRVKDRKCKFAEMGTPSVNTGIFDVKLTGTYTS